MKRRDSHSGARSREKKCTASVIVAALSKRERPRKVPPVFINTIPTCTSNTNVRCFGRLIK